MQQENAFDLLSRKENTDIFAPPHLELRLALSRQHVPSRSEHLSCYRGRETIHLSGILLHLPRVQQHLQPTRLDRQLEQASPLVLGQGRLLRQRARGVFRLAFLLPGGNFGLLAAQLALVVLVVVELGVMGFDAVEEEIARLFEERVDAEIEGVEVGIQRIGHLRAVDGGERRRHRERAGGWRLGELVEEGGEQVGIVDLNREFGQDF